MIKPYPKPKKKKKQRVWATTTADKKFSEYIRNRDKKCLKCGRVEMLQCSHFWGRNNSSTRYDTDNSITLCYPCHYGDTVHGWEFNKQGEYREFMIKLLGKIKYDLLEKKARQIVQRRTAIIEVMEFLKNL